MKVKKFIEKRLPTEEKLRKVTAKITSEIICSMNGNIVENLAWIGAILVLIVMVVLPAMKNMFNVNIFPGLTDQIDKIYGYS